MTSIKTLATAGMLLAGAAMALAGTDASVKVLPAATRTGTATLQIVGDIGTNGSAALTGVELHLKYDSSKIAIGTFTPAAGTDWVNQSSAADPANAGQWILILTSNNGQLSGNVGTLAVTLTGGGSTVLTNTVATGVSDDGYNTYNPTAESKSAVFTGAYRKLGGPIAGAPSVGPGGVVAVAAGTSLSLLKAADLTDVAGFAAPAVGPVSGRPAFGMVGADAVVAVGDDAGKLTVVKVADGSSVFAGSLGAKVSTPAIDSATGTVYAAVTAASGPASLVKVVSGAQASVATLAGSTVLGAPAVYGGGIVVGTDKGVESFRIDGTPQAGVTDAAGATVAPIIGNGGRAIAANGTSILGFNALTGAATGAATAHGAGALSEAWYDAASDTVLFGTPSGKILKVALASGAPTLGNALTTAAIAAEPIQLGSTVWAIDATGNLVSDAGASVPLGAAGAKAVAATGRTAGTDSVIAATADGGVAAVAF